MEQISIFLLMLIILPMKILNADEINYIDVVESLDTFKIIEALAESLEPGTPCFNDIKEYLGGLLSVKRWALQMYDSSAKVPEGLLLGRKEFFGQFDECIGVENHEGNFTGQFCLLYPILDLNQTIIPEINQRDKDSSSLLELIYGICLPSSCSLFEIGITLREIFSDEDFKNKISVSTGGYCQTKDSSPELTTGSWVLVGFLALVVFIASVGTYFDIYQPHVLKRNNQLYMLTFFSVYTNGRKLFKTSKTFDRLKVLDGIRALSICWVIIHNNYGQLPQFSPVIDRVGIYKRRFDHAHVFATNGYLAVDTFFFLSGLLISFSFFQDLEKKRYYDIPLAYIHRYIRLTPPYAVMMLITAEIFPYLGNGPIWPQVAHLASDSCKKNWWVGLLYVQNYAANKQCLDHTWYLSADMQLHWISPLVLYPLFFWPSLAPFSLCVVILGATFVTFMNAYVNQLGPNDEISRNRLETKLDYMPSHTRAAPWLIGLALGYAICNIKARNIKIKLSKLWIKSGWLACSGLFIVCIYGPLYFICHEYTTVEAALFLALYRVSWGLGLAWIVFACNYGYAGPVNTFLSWSPFEFLGKLSYCAFLLHMPFQYYRIGVTRLTFYGSDTETIYFALGDIVLSFLAAIPLTLLFEIPFRFMDRWFFQNIKILPYPKRERKKAREN